MRKNSAGRHVKEMVKSWISEGHFGDGQKVPSIRKLAEQFDVSPVTASLVIAELRSEGLVESKAGKGTYVVLPRKNKKVYLEKRERVYNIGLAYLSFYQRYLNAPNQSHPILGNLTTGIQEAFGPEYLAIKPLSYEKKDLSHEKSVVRSVIEHKGIDGLLIAGWLTVEEAVYLERQGLPFVLIGHELVDREVSQVTYSTLSGLRLILQHLYSLGHRKIKLMINLTDQAYWHSGPNAFINMARICGFGDFNQKDITVFDNSDANWKPVDYETSFNKLVENGITAVIVQDEVIANRVVTFCLNHGIKIPQEMSIASFSDSGAYTHVMKFTSLNSSEMWIESSRLGGELLKKAIDNDYMKHEKILIMPKLTIGETTTSPCV